MKYLAAYTISFWTFVVSIFLQSIGCSSEKILFFTAFGSYSHLAAFEPLAKALSDRGHAVTVVSPLISKNNYTDITSYCPTSVMKFQEEQFEHIDIECIQERLKGRYNDLFAKTDKLAALAIVSCQAFYRDSDFQDWIKSSQFDLVIIDSFSRRCGLPLAYLFNAKTISFSPASILPYEQELFGWPQDSGTLAFLQTQFIPETFQAELLSLLWYYWDTYNYSVRYDNFFWNEMNLTEMPSMAELERNTSLLMVNEHHSTEFARSLPPFVISVGGMHCHESTGIKDNQIKKFVEDPSSDGFIYISFGSFVKFSNFPPHTQNAFLQTIQSYPKLKFLIKWNGEVRTDFPENSLTANWFDQQDILAHPKCRGFVSQGGLMSFQQSVYHQVPIIILPVAGDQTYNARLAEMNGHGIYLELSEISFDIFRDAIFQILNNQKYSNRLKILSRQFKDRPMSAVDTATWWTEYVLRHDDFSGMKPIAINHHWWQRRMLHFWAIVFSVIFLVIAAIIYVLLQVLRGVRSKLASDYVRNMLGKSKSENKID